MNDKEHMQRHLGDVERLMRLAFVYGTPTTRDRVYEAWRKVSESSAAGWLMPYDNDEWNWSSISAHLEASDQGNAEMHSFMDDMRRIVEVCRANGHRIDERQACTAWHRAGTKSWGANWLELPSYDDELWKEIRPSIEKTQEEES